MIVISTRITTALIIAAMTASLFSAAPAAFAQPTNPKQVTICHNPEVDEDGEVILGTGQTITVGAPAAEAHVREHGDYLGACQSENPPPEEEVFYCLSLLAVPELFLCFETEEECEAHEAFLKGKDPELVSDCQPYQTPPPDALFCIVTEFGGTACGGFP